MLKKHRWVKIEKKRSTSKRYRFKRFVRKKKERKRRTTRSFRIRKASNFRDRGRRNAIARPEIEGCTCNRSVRSFRTRYHRPRAKSINRKASRTIPQCSCSLRSREDSKRRLSNFPWNEGGKRSIVQSATRSFSPSDIIRDNARRAENGR